MITLRPDRTRPPVRRSKVAVLALLCALLAAGMGVVRSLWQGRPAARATIRPAGVTEQTGSSAETPWLNARPGVAYVGSAECARCHAEIADTYRDHPMGKSLTPISEAPTVGFDRPYGVTTFGSGPSRYSVVRRLGCEVHRETRREGRRVLAQVEAEVKYALGSGTRGVAYLVERGGRLFESPISWYGQKHQWDLSPGYEEQNAHFDRPIEPHCLFCHANRVEPVELSVNQYKPPIFLGHAIGCERCHGPGELHVRGQTLVDGRDVSIVNPRHLEPALRSDVCEQCHLLGDQRIDRLDRDPFDYRPGLPLSEFFAVYARASDQGHKAVGHVEQMKLSRCYRESQGRLGCISCHDPHQVPAPEEKIEYFRERCLACHEQSGCSVPEKVRLSQSASDDCVKCHLPRSASVDIVHTATTDHRVLRNPNVPASEPQSAAREFPLVLLNGDDQAGAATVKSMDRELAIAVTSEGPRLPNTPRIRRVGSLVLSFLDKEIAERPDDLVGRRMKAQALSLTGHRADAIALLESVLKSAPSYEQALDDLLAQAIKQGSVETALRPARQAVALNPWSAPYHERLAYVCLERQSWDEALRESQEALRIDPFLRLRMFVVQCFLHQKNLKAAEAEFSTLLELFPEQRDSLEAWFSEQRKRQASL